MQVFQCNSQKHGAFYFEQNQKLTINEIWDAMPGSLTETELNTLVLAQNRQIQQIWTGDLVRLLRVSEAEEQKALRRLVKRGIAVRVRRGLYLVPPSLPLGNRWSPGEALAVTTLMQDAGARFQLCGPNTFHRYGWDEQVPNRTFVYNDKISGDRSVGSIDLTLIRVASDRLGAIDTVKAPEGVAIPYSSRSRSLVDAVYDWSRFNTLPRAFGWIKDDLARSRVDTIDVVEASLCYGNVGTVRRVGFLLEELSAELRIPQKLISRLEQSLPRTTSTIPFVPTFPKRGRISRRWGLVENETPSEAS